MEQYYLEFDDSDENKLSYTAIFSEYVSHWARVLLPDVAPTSALRKNKQTKKKTCCRNLIERHRLTGAVGRPSLYQRLIETVGSVFKGKRLRSGFFFFF